MEDGGRHSDWPRRKTKQGPDPVRLQYGRAKGQTGHASKTHLLDDAWLPKNTPSSHANSLNPKPQQISSTALSHF